MHKENINKLKYKILLNLWAYNNMYTSTVSNKTTSAFNFEARGKHILRPSQKIFLFSFKKTFQ